MQVNWLGHPLPVKSVVAGYSIGVDAVNPKARELFLFIVTVNVVEAAE